MIVHPTSRSDIPESVHHPHVFRDLIQVAYDLIWFTCTHTHARASERSVVGIACVWTHVTREWRRRRDLDGTTHGSSSLTTIVKRTFICPATRGRVTPSQVARGSATIACRSRVCLFGSSTRATAASPSSPRTPSSVLCGMPLLARRRHRRHRVRTFFSGKISCRYNNISQYKHLYVYADDDLSCYQLQCYIVVIVVIPKLLIVR